MRWRQSLLAAFAVGTWWWSRGAEARQTRAETIPEIGRLIDQQQWSAAFTLAQRAERVLHDDPELMNLWPQMSSLVSFEITPTGGEVLFREYSDVDGQWTSLGPAPVLSARLPRGLMRLQVSHDGYQTVETFVRIGAEASSTFRRALHEEASVPAGMVAIDGGSNRPRLRPRSRASRCHPPGISSIASR